MSYLHRHLEQILSGYSGGLPLHHFLREYFRRHPKLGSRDRRGLSDAAYAWYRVGKMLHHAPCSEEEKHIAALQLCSLRPKAFEAFFPSGNEIESSLVPANFALRADEIFPFEIPFSEGIQRCDWLESMKRQPRLFLRIRSGQKEIISILEEKNIAFENLGNNCLALPNGTDVERLFQADRYVVQDASSQACGAFLIGKNQERWWDSCAGAGGKSLLLTEQSKGISLLATDLRPNILHNLKDRFRSYHLPIPECLSVDVSHAQGLAAHLGKRLFEGIICDVPCSGSGTWARTPENCYFFQPEALKKFNEKQVNILINASRHLAPGGRIVYITCSVFRCENEAIVEAASAATGLQVVTMKLINGLSVQADSLFVAALCKI